MYRKIALVIAAATFSVPVGVVVAGSPAFAATRTHSVSVDKLHKESRDGSKDASKEGSRLDTSKDSSKGTSKDTSKDTSSVDTSPSSDHSAR